MFRGKVPMHFSAGESDEIFHFLGDHNFVLIPNFGSDIQFQQEVPQASVSTFFPVGAGNEVNIMLGPLRQ